MAADSKTVTANGSISPKVFWPLVVSIVLTFLATFLSAITPEMLGELGVLAFPMGLALGAVGQLIAGYLKGDELRDLGVQATAAILPVAPTSETVPYAGTVAPATTGSTIASETLEESPESDATARLRAELDGR